MRSKIALVTGINGQDGAYLSKLLLKKNYKVFGLIRRSSTFKLNRLEYLGVRNKINFVHGELNEFQHISNLVKKIRPDLIFNLGAQSFVQYSFENPSYTFDINSNAVLNFLETIRRNNLDTRFYQASTSEMYGNPLNKFQDEKTVFRPDSPYAISKLSAHNLVRNYRESFGNFLTSGILFNHESFLRGIEFVTKKIIFGLVSIKFGSKKPLELGNIYSKRDWGHAEDYVNAIYKIIKSNKPSDYVVATGETHTVKQFLEVSAKGLGFKPDFVEIKNNIKCFDKKSGILLAKMNKKYLRYKDLTYLRGNPKKIIKDLKWKPNYYFYSLIDDMLKNEIENFKSGLKFTF